MCLPKGHGHVSSNRQEHSASLGGLAITLSNLSIHHVTKLLNIRHWLSGLNSISIAHTLPNVPYHEQVEHCASYILIINSFEPRSCPRALSVNSRKRLMSDSAMSDAWCQPALI